MSDKHTKSQDFPRSAHVSTFKRNLDRGVEILTTSSAMKLVRWRNIGRRNVHIVISCGVERGLERTLGLGTSLLPDRPEERLGFPKWMSSDLPLHSREYITVNSLLVRDLDYGVDLDIIVSMLSVLPRAQHQIVIATQTR